MNFADASTLLWAQQLKREHKHLLGKILSLESRQTPGASPFGTRDESSAERLEQLALTLTSIQRDLNQLKEENNIVKSQFHSFCSDFARNLQDAFKKQLQESGLPSQVTNIHKTIDSLNAEIEDDSLALTSTVKSLKAVQKDTECLVERIFSLDHWVAKLKTDINASCNIQSLRTENFESIFLKLDLLIHAKEQAEKKTGELEHEIALLRSQISSTEEANTTIEIPSNAKATEARNKQDLLDMPHELLMSSNNDANMGEEAPRTSAGTADIDKERSRSSQNPLSISEEKHGDAREQSSLGSSSCTSADLFVQAPDRSVDASKPSLNNEHVAPAMPGTFISGSNGVSKKLPRRKEKLPSRKNVHKEVCDSQENESDSKRLRYLLPEVAISNEKFLLPVTLSGRQTRSRTRAATSTDKGHGTRAQTSIKKA